MPTTKTIKQKRKSNARIEQIRSANTRSSLGFLSGEQAGILNDYLRLYVGAALPYPTPQSGVYMQQDTVLLTQYYLDKAGYPLYDEVERDPQVSATLQARKLAVAGLPWHILSDDEEQDDLCDTIENKIRAIPGFYQDMIELLDAIGKGLAVSEIDWGVDSEGWVVPVNILNRPQRRIQFNATDATLKIRTLQDPFYGIPAYEKKFITHRNSQKYEIPFGDAIDQRIYWMWLFKRNVIKFWMMFLENNAGPNVFITVPKNADDTLKAEAQSIAQNIRAGTGGYKIEGMTIEYVETKNALTSAETYSQFVRFADDEITKCILSQTLTTEASGTQGSGSRALGTVHQSVKQDLLQYDAKCLADTLTQTLVRWMCDMNFVDLKTYPRFEFLIQEPQDKVAQTQAVKNLTDAGKNVDNSYITDEIGIPLNEDEPNLKPTPQPPPQNTPQLGQQPVKEFAHGASDVETYEPHSKVKADENVYQEQIGTIGKFNIWRVDGEYIRDNIEVDYVEGGNPGRYTFIPEGEIWLESEFSLADLYATMIHEYIEAFHMINDDMKYDDAHDKANVMELGFRKLVQKGTIKPTFENAKSFLETNLEK